MSSSLTLTLRVPPSFLTISPPPPLHSCSLQFHILPHTRPILSISSLFFNSCSSSRNPRKTSFRSRVSRASVGTVVRPRFSTSRVAQSPLFISVHHVSSPSHFLSLL